MRLWALRSRLFLISFVILTNFVFSQSVTWNYSSTNDYIVSYTSTESEIINLQKLFKSVWLYDWNLNWNYEDIKNTIVNYQLERWIIALRSDSSAWIFTKKTAEFIKKDFFQKDSDVKNTTNKDVIKKDNYFIVTAYYSPLPNQKKYITWTYSWDIKLNWNWTHWASWKAVHAWFLAAPKKYGFWTKIEIEWLWIWVVEDRWWAIVQSGVNWHEHDRIDIWMWYGDAWLERAIKRGKKTVKWKIVSNDAKLTINFKTYVVDKYGDLSLNWDDPKKEDVERLQELFKKLRLYEWEIDWEYNNIKKELLDFQKKSWIIENDDDWWAWWFWQQTFIALREEFWYIEEDENGNLEYKSTELTKKQKENLNKLRKQIEIYVSKKTNWDMTKQENYIKSIKNQLENYMEKVDDKKRKEFKYLISVL